MGENTAYTSSGREGKYLRDMCDGWHFGGEALTDDEVTGIDFDDGGWKIVNIPHTWNIKDAEDGGNDYLRTAFWYRKKLDYDETFDGKKVYLEFNGSNQKTDLYVNGTHVPYNGGDSFTHKGGYTAFRFDVTDYLVHGQNVLAVRVDNSHDEAIAPISADFNMCGGIYRRVFLVVVDKVHFDLDNNGSSGLFLTTPDVRSMTAPESLGTVIARTELVNDSDVVRNVMVKTVIEGDNAPKAVSEQLNIPAHGRVLYERTVKVANPHLWQGISYERETDICAGSDKSEGIHTADAGYMYTVKINISDGDKVLDEVSDRVGFRYFFVDREKGFFLNGKSHPLRGVNRHQFYKGMGNALTEAEHEEDVNIIKELGANAVRLCHYPHTDYFYDLCDENGIVLWTEIPLVNALGESEEFAENTKRQLVELMRQQYNRPSVIFWGLQNEIGNGDNSASSFMNAKQLVYELDELAHGEDSSGRYTTQAINRDYAMNQKGTADYADFTNNTGWKSDIAAWNIYPGWYPDKNFDGNFEQLMDRKASFDNRPMGISEYGWGANVNQHELYPELEKNGLLAWGQWHPEEYQSIMHEQALEYINTHECLWATFVWVLFDFAVDSRNEGGQIALNDKGLVTGDRKIRKDSFYLYKADWNKADSFVHITSSRYVDRESVDTYVKVYSNCDNVELYVNGVSVGEMEHRGNGVFMVNKVRLINGMNEIKAVGSIDADDEEYTDVCEWRLI